MFKPLKGVVLIKFKPVNEQVNFLTSFSSAISPGCSPSISSKGDGAPGPCLSTSGTRIVSAPAVYKRKNAAVTSSSSVTTCS